MAIKFGNKSITKKPAKKAGGNIEQECLEEVNELSEKLRAEQSTFKDNVDANYFTVVTGDVSFSATTTTIIDTVDEYGYGIDYGVAYGGGSASSSRTAMTTQLTTSTSENLAQRLLIRLRTFRGEWFLDENLGIDYFGQILGKNRNKSTVDTIIQSEILQEQEVLQLAEYNSVYDNALRKLNISFKARTLDGFYAVVDLTI